MNRTDKTAAELIADMNRLQAELDLTRCKCCKRPLNTYVQPGLRPTSPTYVYGTCFNEACPRFTITREVNDLASLTEADIAQFHQAVANS